MRQPIRMSASVGGPTILTIFLVLCLATLGTLSLVTANAEARLADKTAAAVAAYYEADARGEAFLADTAAALAVGGTAAVVQQQEDREGSLATRETGGRLWFGYETQVDEARTLEVWLSAGTPAAEPLAAGQETGTASLRVESWKVVPNDRWNYEEFEITID